MNHQDEDDDTKPTTHVHEAGVAVRLAHSFLHLRIEPEVFVSWAAVVAFAVAILSAALVAVAVVFGPPTPMTITSYQLKDGYQPGSVCTCAAFFLAGEVLYQQYNTTTIVAQINAIDSSQSGDGSLVLSEVPDCPPLTLQAMREYVLNETDLDPACGAAYYLDLYLQSFWNSTFAIGSFSPDTFYDDAREEVRRNLLLAGPLTALAMSNAVVYTAAWFGPCPLGPPASDNCRSGLEGAQEIASRYTEYWPRLPLVNVSDKLDITERCADAICTKATPRSWWDSLAAVANLFNTVQNFTVFVMAFGVREWFHRHDNKRGPGVSATGKGKKKKSSETVSSTMELSQSTSTY